MVLTLHIWKSSELSGFQNYVLKISFRNDISSHQHDPHIVSVRLFFVFFIGQMVLIFYVKHIPQQPLFIYYSGLLQLMMLRISSLKKKKYRVLC